MTNGTGQQNGTTMAASQSSAAAVRLPTFTPAKPALWFALIERYFEAAKITTEAAKFTHAVLSLDARYTAEIEDLILRPHADQPFTTLKEQLVKRLSASQEEKIRELLEKATIGDRKPSQFLRELRSLGGTVFNDDVLRTIWSSRLPNDMQAILSTQQTLSLDQLADLADNINATYKNGGTQHVSEASQNPTPAEERLYSMITQMFAELRAEMNDSVKREISAVQRTGRSTDRTTNHHHSQPRNRSSSRKRSFNSEFCWYHNRFGANARKCTPPCTFSGNATGPR